MTEALPNDAFERFQRQVARVAAVAAAGAVAAVLVGRMAYTPVAGGLAVGFAASLACHALKVRSLRRLRRRAGRVRRGRAGLAAIGRIAVCGAALAVASGLEQLDVLAAAGGLFLTSGVTIVLAVGARRRAMPEA